MSVLEFISRLVAALAWPAVTLLICWVFRTHIGNLIGRVRRGSGFGFSFETSESVEDVLAEPTTGITLTVVHSRPSDQYWWRLNVHGETAATSKRYPEKEPARQEAERLRNVLLTRPEIDDDSSSSSSSSSS